MRPIPSPQVGDAVILSDDTEGWYINSTLLAEYDFEEEFWWIQTSTENTHLADRRVIQAKWDEKRNAWVEYNG